LNLSGYFPALEKNHLQPSPPVWPLSLCAPCTLAAAWPNRFGRSTQSSTRSLSRLPGLDLWPRASARGSLRAADRGLPVRAAVRRPRPSAFGLRTDAYRHTRSLGTKVEIEEKCSSAHLGSTRSKMTGSVVRSQSPNASVCRKAAIQASL
jgi:hypothetical protein